MIVKGTHLEMIRGDSEAIRVSLENAQGDAIPLQEGDKIIMTVKENANDEMFKLRKEAEQLDEGELIFNFLPSDTKPLSFKRYYYDIELNKADGHVKTLVPISGFTILEEITNE